MPAYLLADVKPHDMQAYRDSGYLEAVVRIAADYGGRYLARGGEMQRLEGDWEPRRMVIIEFPSMADLRAWYDSAEYAPWREVRKGLADSRLVAVDGLSAPPQ
ncbi:MAG TPA: DUF1330 domain-containing protein [Gammaproteobacteria bacterium]